ncbi:MAG: outer membrane beta-barrel protein [Mariprofundales bacterium]|nr:outer membrane beta-barrel protein [Mariprofundales bacterium]
MIAHTTIYRYMRPLALAIGLGLIATPAWAGSLSDKLDNINISGFVDGSFSGQSANRATASTGFGLDQVELDVEYSRDNVGLRFDLQGSPSAGGSVSQDSLFEQGYLYYTVSGIADEGVTFTFGKFNAPIGWELLDAPDMYQFSHALVFNNGLPTNLTGASLAAKLGVVDGIIYYANQVDTNGVTTTGIRSAGGRLGITPAEGVNVGISYLSTGNPGNTADRTLDIDFTYSAIANLLIGGEYNQVKALNVTSGGYFITAHYDFNDMIGATYRYGTWDNDTNRAGKVTSNTVALTTTLGEGFGALAEYRIINNSTAVATGDGFGANFNTKAYAFEMTYSF